jgi:hypothetical protein
MGEGLDDKMIRGQSKEAVLDSVHAIETPSMKACENPICDVRFNPTSLPWLSQRYCSPACRQQASIIQRVAKLLKDLSDDEIVKVIRG